MQSHGCPEKSAHDGCLAGHCSPIQSWFRGQPEGKEEQSLGAPAHLAWGIDGGADHSCMAAVQRPPGLKPVARVVVRPQVLASTQPVA